MQSGGAGSHGASDAHRQEGSGNLLQRAVDRSELVVEVAAQAVHHSDNRKRDTRCDQAVFNRGRAGFIRQEF